MLIFEFRRRIIIIRNKQQTTTTYPSLGCLHPVDGVRLGHHGAALEVVDAPQLVVGTLVEAYDVVVGLVALDQTLAVKGTRDVLNVAAVPATGVGSGLHAAPLLNPGGRGVGGVGGMLNTWQ